MYGLLLRIAKCTTNMIYEVFNYFVLFVAGSSLVAGKVVVTITVSDEIIATSTGKIRGAVVQDANLKYYAYKGIPYAEKPTGNLRFKPPLQKTPWSGVLNATTHGNVCHQSGNRYSREQMSEDCLFLNIYVPANKTKKIPVYAHVHGGEFKSLSGNDDLIYGPNFFVERYVILVTMNYRLGAMGFLSLETEEASGNAGIKDVILALKWIKRNIRKFGGDPNKITLGGNSAGAGLAHLVLLSNKSSQLFKQAILISGSALSYRFVALHPKANALALGRQLNMSTDNTTNLLMNLRKADAFDIVAAQQDMEKNDTRKGIRAFAPFVPSIEIDYNDAVITKLPLQIIRAGIPQNVPILAGFNSQEGIKQLPIVKKNNTLIELINNNFERCIPTNIEYPYGSQQSKNLADGIRKFYLRGGDITNSTLINFVDLLTDMQFAFPIDAFIKWHKERNDSNVVYYYVFNFDGDLNYYKIANDADVPGTSHGDELGYLFKTKVTAPLLDSIDSRTRRARDNFMNVLTEFIKSGNPTQSTSDDNKWPPTEEQRNYLILNDQPQHVTRSKYTDRLNFWYNVYQEYFKYLRDGGKLEDKIVP